MGFEFLNLRVWFCEKGGVKLFAHHLYYLRVWRREKGGVKLSATPNNSAGDVVLIKVFVFLFRRRETPTPPPRTALRRLRASGLLLVRIHLPLRDLLCSQSRKPSFASKCSAHSPAKTHPFIAPRPHPRGAYNIHTRSQTAPL